MWKCNECGCIFETPKVWKEDRGECWGTRAYETMYGCPVCESSDYDEYTGENEEDEEGENDDDD